jgi:hypothetical protein
MPDHAEYRRLREALKAELRARHDAAPDDYLSEKTDPLPPASGKLRRPPVWWWIDKPKKRTRGPHRRTQNPPGCRANDDAALARAVYDLVQIRGVDRMHAEHDVAQSLAQAVYIDQKSARARVRKALRKSG